MQGIEAVLRLVVTECGAKVCAGKCGARHCAGKMRSKAGCLVLGVLVKPSRVSRSVAPRW